MTQTIAIIGAGPGLGRSVARQFGLAGFRVALVARSADRLEAFAAELKADNIEAAAFPADLADRTALPGLISAINSRFGEIDVLQYAPAGPDWMTRQTDVRECDADSFEFPLDLLLRTPADLIRQVLPGMLTRDRGAILFGLPATAVKPYPQLANAAAAAAAARAYLQCLHASLTGTNVYAGLLLVGGMVGHSDAAHYATEKWGAQALPAPLDPADLAAALWTLYRDRTNFETLIA
jgi:NADP-dependent 3-hydroxy acid dehydrogenase YdfG